jgi:predicted MPP superfamily phosphohydrolase
MAAWTGFALFFLIVTTVYGGAHYYLYRWFLRLFEPGRGWGRFLGILFLFLVLSFPGARVLGWIDFNPLSYGLTLISALWMGFSLYFFLFAVSTDIFMGIWRWISGPSRLSPRHRLLFQRRWMAGLAIGVLGIAIFGLQEAKNVQVTRLEIQLQNLPATLDGYRVVQVSDVHYGMLTENGKLAKLVEQVNQLHADLIVITGDLVDEGVSHMEQMTRPLQGLKARDGVLAVTGNHEYYAGVNRATAIMEKAKIRVLRNERIILPGGLQVLGIDDPTGSRRMGETAANFQGLLASLDPLQPSIFLYHQPIRFAEAASFGIGLQLSGHTHGGQLFPMRYISQLIYPLTPGLHRIGRSYLYVNRGAGTWGPPMRLGSPPEITLIRLRSPKGKE